MEWVRFAIVAALLLAALAGFTLEVAGVWKFGFVMNRMHAAGIGDTWGLMCIAAAMMVYSGLNLTSLKILMLVLFMWFTSPTSTHFLSQIEVNTNEKLGRYLRRMDADGTKRDL